ncbi:DUF397 domain-containing protein [Streptomyces sp. NPDC058284]|uniref:DUF397 domain-containing protein n=1 Tax=unclassified Streptomyces TaxID=2593676 RepID=UPI003661900C
MQYSNGVAADQIPDVRWIKAKASTGSGNCVELASLPQGEVAVRNSRHPDGPALVFTREEIAAFVTGVKDAEFDHLTP